MHWLIAEDALHGRQGHWFEYVSTFHRGLCSIGDGVTVLADRGAEPFIREQLNAIPILPRSIWHRMSDGAGPLRRCARVPLHAWQTYHSMRRFLQTTPTDLRSPISPGPATDHRPLTTGHCPYDLIFIPTVLVHHLLGWVWLIKRVLRHQAVRVLLFFPNAPIRFDPATRKSDWLPSPTSRLFARLIRSLSGEVRINRVILGAETHPMRDALTQLTGVPFTYLPHPVQPFDISAFRFPLSACHHPFLFASYGPARHEKGSDVLQAAVRSFLAQAPAANVRFALQWLEDFNDDRGHRATRETALEQNGRVQFITRLFHDGEYAEWLQRTHALLLPYRISSYALRVSRVVIEALVNGIPVVATRGTTLAAQASEYGALIECEDGCPDGLAIAIRTLSEQLDRLAATARARCVQAQRHFSVRHFRELLCSGWDDGCGPAL